MTLVNPAFFQETHPVRYQLRKFGRGLSECEHTVHPYTKFDVLRDRVPVLGQPIRPDGPSFHNSEFSREIAFCTPTSTTASAECSPPPAHAYGHRLSSGVIPRCRSTYLDIGLNCEVCRSCEVRETRRRAVRKYIGQRKITEPPIWTASVIASGTHAIRRNEAASQLQITRHCIG